MNSRQIRTLERVFKGVSNHWRIKILLSISENEDIILDEIVSKLKSNYQTTSEHTRRLKAAGLITKHYMGQSVCHNLSPYGKKVLKIVKTFLN